MSKKRLKIAITGSIGSGKSAFAELIKQKGFTVLNADNISKEILASDPDIKKEIIKVFGQDSFKGNEIDRKYLAEKVFSDPDNVQIINKILHPVVIKRISDLMENDLKTMDKIFVEAALIYEADMEEMFDYVVLVTADKEIRFTRKSEVLSRDEFEKRDMNQIPDSEKRKRADFIFENNGSIKELKNKVDLLLSLL